MKILCLDTEHRVCTFERFPHNNNRSQVYYVGNGCACIRTLCLHIFIDYCPEIANGTNLCVCNFSRIVGCDFDYSVPLTTMQLIEAEYTLYYDVPHLQIGMNIDLLKAILIHPDTEQLGREVNSTTQLML